MSYRQNAAANRDALFGGGGNGGGSKRSNKPSSSRPSAPSSSSAAAAPSSYSSRATPSASSGRGYSYGAKMSSSSSKKPTRPALTGEARAAKIKEAEEHRKQAKKCMARGVFSKPDPVAASMYYKRAADAYQQCGEDRMEKIHRVACADCQVQQGAYATAAAEYTRAAEIVRDSNINVEEKRKEGSMLYGQAANAFLQLGDAGKAGKSMVQSAVAWTWEDDSGVLEKRALTSMEEAVESFVPDILNRYARYRQTGSSSFVNPNSDEKPDLELARQHMVTSSYAHEPLLDMCYILIQHREFPSALYAAGAASAILESDGISTLTLGRVYVLETIVLLAMGDPVAAEQTFLNTHVQKTSYLTSRECKLAEDLFRAILQRDPDALEEARSPQGPNRSAMANLHESARALVTQLRISGAARKSVPKAAKPSAPVAAAPPAVEELFTPNPETEAPPPVKAPVPKHPEEEDIDELHAEMDDLLNDMGLGSDSEGDVDDDDIDLR